MTNKFDTKNYWESRLESNYNLKGVGDIGLSESYNKSLYRVRGNVFRYAIRDITLDKAKINVLDIGSGTGFYIKQWLQSGAKKYDRQ